MDISVVVPLFNEEESIPELFAWIERVMKANGFSYETTENPRLCTVALNVPKEMW